jgi:hypothetical protein
MKVIYTDGACRRNPDGEGGWAAVILSDGNAEPEIVYGAHRVASNNQMELMAVIRGLEAVEPGVPVTVISVSAHSLLLTSFYNRNSLSITTPDLRLVKRNPSLPDFPHEQELRHSGQRPKLLLSQLLHQLMFVFGQINTNSNQAIRRSWHNNNLLSGLFFLF